MNKKLNEDIQKSKEKLPQPKLSASNLYQRIQKKEREDEEKKVPFFKKVYKPLLGIGIPAVIAASTFSIVYVIQDNSSHDNYAGLPTSVNGNSEVSVEDGKVSDAAAEEVISTNESGNSLTALAEPDPNSYTYDAPLLKESQKAYQAFSQAYLTSLLDGNLSSNGVVSLPDAFLSYSLYASLADKTTQDNYLSLLELESLDQLKTVCQDLFYSLGLDANVKADSLQSLWINDQLANDSSYWNENAAEVADTYFASVLYTAPTAEKMDEWFVNKEVLASTSHDFSSYNALVSSYAFSSDMNLASVTTTFHNESVAGVLVSENLKQREGENYLAYSFENTDSTMTFYQAKDNTSLNDILPSVLLDDKSNETELTETSLLVPCFTSTSLEAKEIKTGLASIFHRDSTTSLVGDTYYLQESFVSFNSNGINNNRDTTSNKDNKIASSEDEATTLALDSSFIYTITKNGQVVYLGFVNSL